MSGSQETITIRVKRKYLWLILIILMVLLAASPILALYAPTSGFGVPSVPPSSGGGPSGGGNSTSGGGGGPAPNCGNPCTIPILNSVFGGNSAQLVSGQPTVIVKQGTTIYWKNIDDTSHTSTSLTGLWNTGTLPPGATSKGIAFNNVGTFPYQCLIHPMNGQIIVVT